MNRTAVALLLVIVSALAWAGVTSQSSGPSTPAPGSRAAAVTPGAAANYDEAKRRAEELYAEGSYALAHAIYAALAEDGSVPETERNWVRFRAADTLWRSEASTRATDTTRLEEARRALETMAAAVTRAEDRDRLWAEIQESLGDFWWSRPEMRNWPMAWTHYQQALDWWAGSDDLDPARGRYLGIVRRAARPQNAEPWFTYGYYGNQLPVEVIDSALRIARAPDDVAHLQYLLAMTLRNSGADKRNHRRTREAFEAAIALGGTPWYDDALFNYASWNAQMGRLARERNAWVTRPDYAEALRLFRKLVSERPKGESRYYDDAVQQIEEITKPTVSVAVANVFFPGSEIQYHLGWRNVTAIDLALYRFDLMSDMRQSASRESGNWVDGVTIEGRKAVARWTHKINPDERMGGEHAPGSAVLHLAERLPAGAYLIEARAGKQTARDFVLVTAASIVLKTAPSKIVVYVADARDGAPRPGAAVSLWVRRNDDRQEDRRWERLDGRTDDSGLAGFDRTSGHGAEILAVARDGDDQAIAQTGFSWWDDPSDREPWRVYATTDRPAYRPGETVKWKAVARRQSPGGYVTPSGQTILYEITDPRGAKVAEANLALNAFGSAWADLALTTAMPLGEYQVVFKQKDGNAIGSATLFRLEEYKRPEFQVAVTPPEEDGRPKVFRAGEAVEADIVASYYFGGPVAGAEVEVVVQQRPYWITWQPERDYPWLYQDAAQAMQMRPWHGGGQVVHRETLRTDAEGKARVRFQTPGSEHQDFEYAIEARVTDASRREITGQGKVRVSRQLYSAFARADHNIYAPGDEVRATIRTMDANERPVPGATGRVTVTRERWIEIWVDPDGREVSGDELVRERAQSRIFPPPPKRPGGPGWIPRFRGYKSEVILERSLSTGASGEAEVKFTAQREGYYKIAWSSEETDDFPVRSETTVWVADRNVRELGYHHHGGVGIIVDEETFHEGRKGPVMLTTQTPGAYVLFSIEADDLLEYRLVHMTGTAKLIELDIAQRHVPNIFLEAASVQDGNLHLDSKEVIVPPERSFLTVELTSDREEYQPRETGVFRVTTRDHEGRPVPAEVALGLIDASVLYIQKEYAPDPREFFFGQKRTKRVQVSSSFDQRPYADLTIDENGVAIDRRAAEMRAAGVDEEKDALRDAERSDQVARLSALGYLGKQEMAADMAGAKSMVAREALPASAPATLEGVVGGLPEEGAAVVVRTDFRATAFWQPDVVTGDDGSATVNVTFPDSLTTWKGSARAASSGSQFGQDAMESRTSKPLIARLQAPRFFVAGDEVTLSAVINNNTTSDLRVRASLEAEGVEIIGASSPLVVPAGGEARADWQAHVTRAGQARLRVTARADAFNDAMEQSLPVYEHGIEKLLTRAGTLRGEEAIVTLDLPAARRPGSTSLTIRVAPSLAVTMLDALPYLIDYPYGCTEQTMSRFLPAVVVAKTLQDLGLKPEDIATRVFGGIETAHAEATHPDGKKDLVKLDDMVRAGLDRLYDFQHDDGGWGWWKQGESDHFMTAYVVWGLGIARDAGVNIRDGALHRGIGFLDAEIIEQEENPDIQAFMLHALTASAKPGGGSARSRTRMAAFDNLWSRRDSLNAYSRALLALAAHHLGDAERALALARNLANGVKRDDAPDASVLLKGSQGRAAETMGTAHWGEDGLWWRWSEGGVEATAFALRALLAIDPENALVEPVTTWLIRNRRGAQWSNTRDTAMVVLAMTDYLRASGELAADLDYTIDVNGKRIVQRRIGPADVLSAPSGYVVDPSLLRDGANQIRIARSGGSGRGRGTGRLYFAAEAVFFSTEEPVTAAGSGLFIRRNFYKQVGRPTLLKGTIYHGEPLADGGSVTSGERVDVVLTFEAKNHYEYIVLEDLKAAGLEAVEVRSGEAIYAREIRASAQGRDPASREPQDYTGRSRWVHQELRDRKVALFLDKLPEGIWEIRYELRAEVPGSFHALPAMAHAMYVPEIRGNSGEMRVTVQDRQPVLSGR